MSLFHTHKFGLVNEDNFQYCETCGVAKAAPNPCKNGHKYKEYNVSDIITMYGKTQQIQNLMCVRCGHMTQFNSTTGHYTR